MEGSGSVLGTMLGVLPHHLADDWRSHKSSRGDAGDGGVVRTVNPRRGGAVRVTWRHRTKPGSPSPPVSSHVCDGKNPSPLKISRGGGSREKGAVPSTA